MNFSIRRALIAFAGLLALAGGSLPAQAVPIVSIVAPSTPVEVGSLFSVDVAISGATDIFGYQFDLFFDPLIVEAADQTEGSFLSDHGSTFFIPAVIDNVAGVASGTANTLLTAISGSDGGGILASFHFRGLGAGGSEFSLSSVLLLDSALRLVDAGLAGGRVEVGTPPTAVSEPSVAALLIAGLMIGGVLMTRRFRIQVSPYRIA